MNLATKRVPAVIVGAALLILLAGFFLVRHARSEVNTVALTSQPKKVTVTNALAAEFREQRRYVGTFQPLVEAHVGPQLTAAYVSTVLVRPGTVVKRGDVLATLGCRDASTASRAMAEQANALESRQKAAAAEAERLRGLLEGGFVSPNEVEKRVAESAAAASQLEGLRSQASGKELGVGDCVQRAPFDGEIAERRADPGTYVRPGSVIVTVIDRSTVRLVVNIPERDVGLIDVGTPVKIHALATNAMIDGKVTRRSPSAIAATRTVRVEIDVADSDRALPVGTTADVHVDVGTPQPATQIPLTAARVRGDTASIMTIDGDIAKRVEVTVLGERRGQLFVEAKLAEGTTVVIEGRAQLREGDHVLAQLVGGP
ncbi:MAG: efflux RND transporter periplasmic adaptor subunit [Clostridia bacterium]|nr:efflux RND transporter periplasmic adaptor subunit [Deltaproteobacteria bacterium]